MQFNKLRETYKEFYKHLKQHKQIEIPETDPLLKTMRRLKPRLFHTKPKINRYKKIDIEESSDEIDTADSILTPFSDVRDSTQNPRLALGRKQTYREIRQNHQDLTMSAKFTSYYNKFKNSVRNFFGAEVEQQVAVEKVMRVIQTEKYALSKAIEK